MNFTEKLDVYNRENTIVAFASDGISEKRVLKRFSNIFNGKNKTIFWSTFPTFSGKRGLPSFEVIKYCTQNYTKFQINKFLVIIDAEHFSLDIKLELEEALRKWGLNIQQIFNINDGAFKIIFSVGGRNFIIYVVILGKGRYGSLEDHIALLTKLQTGIDINCLDIEPQQKKQKIREALSKVRKDTKELVEKSNSNNMKKAFSQLTAIFKEIERCY